VVTTIASIELPNQFWSSDVHYWESGAVGLHLGKAEFTAPLTTKSQEFVRWYEQIVRYIRKAFVRNPASLSGYVGAAAYKWFLQGGLLLPTFLPPETDVWRKFFADEDLIRIRLKETSDTTRNFSTPD